MLLFEPPAFFVGALLLALRHPFALLGQALLLFELAALLRFLTPRPFDQRKTLLLFGPALRQRLLPLLQLLDPFRLRLAPALQLGDAFRLLALALAFGRRMLPFALAPPLFEVGEPFLLRDSSKAGLFRLPLDPLDPLTLLLALPLLSLAQAFELAGDLLLIDDHRLDGLDLLRARACCDVHRRISEPEHQHRSNDDVEQYGVHDRHQPIGQWFSLHCRCVIADHEVPGRELRLSAGGFLFTAHHRSGASVISPTLGAPARCSTDIRTTTSP